MFQLKMKGVTGHALAIYQACKDEEYLGQEEGTASIWR